MKIRHLIIFLSIAQLSWGQKKTDSVPQPKASDYRKEIRMGNELYRSNKAVDAETAYRRANSANASGSEALFNLGDALYRQQKYDQAGQEFEKAVTQMTDEKDKARAYHNLGNSYFQQKKFKESIEAYKQALRNNPDDNDTKTNLSYALRQLQQQQNQEQQNKDNKDQKGNKEQQDKEKQDQQNQQDNKDKQDNKGQQEQQNQQEQQGQQEQQPQDDQQQKEQGGQKQEHQITPEDAQRMLEVLERREKDLQEKVQKKERAGYRPKIEKNW